jgi:NAD(P)-dependent dehydrogenase (short-subunit alcohol dehydrogenase family)
MHDRVRFGGYRCKGGRVGICDGRVVIVTGGGRGVGRGHCLEFARQGAKVVVNDLGGDTEGSGDSRTPAAEVVDEIRAMGGEAVANYADVSNFEQAKQLIDSTVATFGTLDVLVNNAGILRDRMLFNMGEDEWDAVMRVHLRWTFAPTRHAAVWWREQAKKGAELDARVITTTSVSGTFGNAGQANYSAAKGGIASFTLTVSRELERYGVMVNCVSPGGATRLTAQVGNAPREDVPEGEWDQRSADNVAPIVVWLGSPESRGVTGWIFEANGGRIFITESYRRGPGISKDGRWDPAELGPLVKDLLSKAHPPPKSIRG